MCDPIEECGAGKRSSSLVRFERIQPPFPSTQTGSVGSSRVRQTKKYDKQKIKPHPVTVSSQVSVFLSLAERQSSATANILCRFQSVQCARAVCVLLKEKNTETRAELPSFSIPWNRCSDPNLFVLFQEFPTFSEVSRNLLHNLRFMPSTFIDGNDLVVVVVAVVYFCSHIRQECLPRMLLLTLTLMRLFY